MYLGGGQIWLIQTYDYRMKTHALILLLKSLISVSLPYDLYKGVNTHGENRQKVVYHDNFMVSFLPTFPFIFF